MKNANVLWVISLIAWQVIAAIRLFDDGRISVWLMKLEVPGNEFLIDNIVYDLTNGVSPVNAHGLMEYSLGFLNICLLGFLVFHGLRSEKIHLAYTVVHLGFASVYYFAEKYPGLLPELCQTFLVLNALAIVILIMNFVPKRATG